MSENCPFCHRRDCDCVGDHDIHWRMREVLKDIQEGNLEELALAAMWNPNGGTADSLEFKSADLACDELLRLAKIGQQHD